MKNEKLKSYALMLMLLLVLSAISVIAQTGQYQERQLASQQRQADLTPDQRHMPQYQMQPGQDRQDRWDDR